MSNKAPGFFTLLLLLSFPQTNGVLFTPALPGISIFFNVLPHIAQITVSLFLLGYTVGQLFYGPLSERFGRKKTLYGGITLQILSSALCALSGRLHYYPLLVIGRCLVGLGAGVGLKMTFTLVHEYYTPTIASKKLAQLLAIFALMPGISIAIGGMLTAHYGWISCFYAGVIHGVILLALVTQLRETQAHRDFDALKPKKLAHDYTLAFKNKRLVIGGLLSGASGALVYIFSSLGPFIAISLLGMTTQQYGFANILPSIALAIGPALSSMQKYSPDTFIKIGIAATCLGAALFAVTTLALPHISVFAAIFIPSCFVYFGMGAIYPSATSIAMFSSHNKAHGSAVMNFVNMASITLCVFGMGYITPNTWSLPKIYTLMCIALILLYDALRKSQKP